MPAPGKPSPPFSVWLSLAIGLFLLGRGLQDVMHRDIDGWTLFRFAGAAYLGWSGVMEWRKFLRRHATQPASAPAQPPRRQIAENPPAPDGESAEPGESPPLRSLVFLLSEPREASPDGPWTQHLARVLGVSFSENSEEAAGFLRLFPHPELTPRGDDCFILFVPGAGVFWILNVKRPYVEDPQGWAKQVTDQRVAEAMSRHRAWISVDLVTWMGPGSGETEAYGVIGKALSALAGPDVLAVLSPELSRCNEWDPGLAEALAGGEPLGIFKSPTFAPVLQVKDDDEQMEAAVAEARARWPEFTARFQARQPGEDAPFLVKAPFSDAGGTEFMWISVSRIEDRTIHGVLQNSPHHLETYFEGQEVSVTLAELNDFVCAGEDGQPLGGFTLRVLGSKMKPRP